MIGAKNTLLEIEGDLRLGTLATNLTNMIYEYAAAHNLTAAHVIGVMEIVKINLVMTQRETL